MKLALDNAQWLALVLKGTIMRGGELNIQNIKNKRRHVEALNEQIDYKNNEKLPKGQIPLAL
jgi:hypothetical protein